MDHDDPITFTDIESRPAPRASRWERLAAVAIVICIVGTFAGILLALVLITS